MNNRRQKPRQEKSDDILENLFSWVSDDFRKYWRPAALVLAATLFVVLAYLSYAGKKSAELETTWTTLQDLPRIHPMMSEPERVENLRMIVDESNRLLSERWRTEATPWVLLRLGNASMELGEHEAATEAYKRIIEKHSGHYVHAMALANLAAAQEQKGEYEHAGAGFRRAAEDEPARWIDSARNYEMAGHRDAAISAYEKALGNEVSARLRRADRELAEFRLNVLRRGGESLASPPKLPDTTPVEEEDDDIEPEAPPEPLPEEEEGEAEADDPEGLQVPVDIPIQD